MTVIDLQGKRIVIAGAASGIGAQTARELGSAGAHVVVGDINVAGAEAVTAEINNVGGRATAVAFDMADEASINAFIERSAAALDGIDGLFNVAADLSTETFGRDEHLLKMDPAVWQRSFQVNLLGFALTARAVIPHLLEQGGGAIVNMSSGAAHGGDPTRPAYAVTKAGVNALTRHIASKWGKKNIRCNAVAPGLVLSEQIQEADDKKLYELILMVSRSPRLGTTRDIAAAACFLLSDAAEWVNGQVWSVDGGLSMRL